MGAARAWGGTRAVDWSARFARPTGVGVARTVDDVRALAEPWAAMGFETVDATIDAFLAILESHPAAVRPHVLVAFRGSAPVAMLVARLEDRVSEARFGYAAVHKARMRCLTVVYGGLAGPAAQELAPMLTRELLGALDAGEADCAFFHKLAMDSPLRRAVVAATRPTRRGRFDAVEPHWSRQLPAGYDELMAALPRRKSMQRYARRLERELGDRISIRRFHAPADLDRVVADLEAIAQRTYQRGLDVGFRADRDRAFVRAGLDGGWFNAWVLYVDGEPRAFEYGAIVSGRYTLGGKGFDPDWAAQRVGNYVALHVLAELCAMPEVRVLDLGIGDAPYKRELGESALDEADLTIYAPTARALSVNAVHSAVAGADRLARRAIGPELANRLKRSWRAVRMPATR
jgi:CelD/BcsL family acetyltransferase involved in cellulose biosynthesis